MSRSAIDLMVAVIAELSPQDENNSKKRSEIKHKRGLGIWISGCTESKD